MMSIKCLYIVFMNVVSTEAVITRNLYQVQEQLWE